MFCSILKLARVDEGNIINKTGLQPVSKPVEQIFGFYPKGLSAKPRYKTCVPQVKRVKY